MSAQTRQLAKPPGDTADMKRAAERLEKDNPRWIVVFGEYTREFVAFPRFAAPQGTVVAARYPEALPGRMRAVEGRARPGPSASAAPGSRPVPVPEPSEGRPGDVARR